MRKVKLIDKENFNEVVWPQTSWGEKISVFFKPLFDNGVETYIPNIRTQLKLVQVDDLILPLAINQKEYDNAYVVSNYYGIHLLKEKLEKKRPFLAPAIAPFLLPLKGIFRYLKINKVVYINTWFYSASLPPEIKVEQMEQIRSLLAQAYPDHLLMFRSITTFLDKGVYEALEKAGFMLVPTREIFVYNPKAKQPKRVRYHFRRDMRLLEQSDYKIIYNKDCNDDDIVRMTELYHKLYVQKYTRFSPQFSSSFLAHLIKNNLLHIVALKKEGKIDSVLGFQIEGKMMQIPFMGYDTDLPHSLGLYRMISVLAYQEADQRSLHLHDGHGADAFKLYRGLEKVPEYTAIYSAHFRNLRRLPWKLAETVMQKIF